MSRCMSLLRGGVAAVSCSRCGSRAQGRFPTVSGFILPSSSPRHTQRRHQSGKAEPAELSLTNQRVAFIGAGRMCEAMVGGLLRESVLERSKVVVTDVNDARSAELKETFGVAAMADNRAAVADADVVVLAVKPQSVPSVMRSMHGGFKEGAILVSIVAGYTVETIATESGCPSVVRAMPNTPALIGQSMTVWTNSDVVTKSQQAKARALLMGFGTEVFVAEEDYLDMATALSGTGPAYAYLIMESMVDTGVHLGLPREMARELVLQTMRGSTNLALASGLHLAELRNNITSPGGTSAAALYESERGGLRSVIGDSVWAAYRRSLEIGGRSSNVGPGRSVGVDADVMDRLSEVMQQSMQQQLQRDEEADS